MGSEKKSEIENAATDPADGCIMMPYAYFDGFLANGTMTKDVISKLLCFVLEVRRASTRDVECRQRQSGFSLMEKCDR